MDQPEKPEFWEASFTDKKEMWGLTPSQSTLIAKDFFLRNSLTKILVPGFGYGRNAQVFFENGMDVTGIEISETAIELARKHYGNNMKVHHGSVTQMPFDKEKYDGVFCYALIHLLSGEERQKLIEDCYSQLVQNGFMIFTMISKEAQTYGTGKYISRDRYEIFEGVKMFFYDEESIHREFGEFGLLDISRITESFPFFFVLCKKN